MKRLVHLSLSIARGIALEQATRRRAMFVLTLATLAMVFVGTFPLWPIFAEHPLFFAIYWLLCIWLTICVFSLAIYDLMVVNRRYREDREKARIDLFRNKN